MATRSTHRKSLHNRARNEAKRSSVELRSLVEGVDFLESLVSIKHLLNAFDIRHHHLFLFRSQNIIDPLRIKFFEKLWPTPTTVAVLLSAL